MRPQLTIGLITISLLSITAALPSVLAQNTTATTATTTSAADRTFESKDGDFRLQIPEGWVIQENEDAVLNPDPNDPATDGETVAVLCLENEALPGIGGEYNCQSAQLTDLISIWRWPELQQRPEFEGEEDVEEGTIITTQDLVALRIQDLENMTRNFQIENSTDVNEFTKIVDWRYEYLEQAGTFLPFDDYTYAVKSTAMIVLSPDRNTGYVIFNNIADDDLTQHSPAVQEVFNSFGVVTE